MNEKEKQRNSTDRERERETEIGVFSMMKFDPATSSFLALLVNKSLEKKLEKAKIKKVSTSQQKNYFLSRKFCQVTDPAKIQDINILQTISSPQETIQYPCFKPEIFSLAHKDPNTWNKNFPKI